MCKRNADPYVDERHAYGMHVNAGTIAALHSCPRHMVMHKLGSLVYLLQFDANAHTDMHMHGRHLHRSQARRERITGLHGDAPANG